MRGKDAGPLPLPARSWQADEPHEALRQRRLRWTAGASAIAVAAALPVLAVPGTPKDAWVAWLGAGVAMAGALGKLYALRPGQTDQRHLAGPLAVVIATGAMLMQAYFGIGSAAAALITVGVLAHAMDDTTRWPRVVVATVCVEHFVLAALSELPGSPIHRVDWHGHASTQAVRLVVNAGTVMVYVMAHLFGRRLLAESLMAQHELETSARAVARTEALLDDARAELDAARAVGRGRFTGVRLGRFELGRLLGSGGMGEVYEARDDGRHAVAVKVLRFGRGGVNAQSLARFERESRVMAEVRSPYLTRVIEVSGDADEFPFIAMELLSGMDLERYLVRYGELTPDELLVLVHDVACALDVAHQHGVVHRDLKPSNIFRMVVDGSPSFRVIDFGVAALQRADVNITTHEVVGTLGYMAPEQHLEGGTVDGRTDLFALATVALECATLFRPIVTALDRRLGQWSPDSLVRREHALSEVPTPVAAVLRRGLADQAADRFESCLAFHRALRRAYDAAGERELHDAPADEVVGLIPSPSRQSPGHAPEREEPTGPADVSSVTFPGWRGTMRP
ncbi:MAG: serine/threonine-protein kinase [Polyangiales bacterium]|nr:serine/threonine protein kinase [Sandaracinaceae bacterium]